MKYIFVLVCFLILKIQCQIPTAQTPESTTTTTTTTTLPPETIPPETTPIITTVQTTRIPTAPTSSHIPTAPTLPTPGQCPETGLVHLPAAHCQDFIVCVYGRPHNARCSDGTLWCIQQYSCVTAANVDCGTRTRP